jgi:hypothetical protein
MSGPVQFIGKNGAAPERVGIRRPERDRVRQLRRVVCGDRDGPDRGAERVELVDAGSGPGYPEARLDELGPEPCQGPGLERPAEKEGVSSSVAAVREGGEFVQQLEALRRRVVSLESKRIERAVQTGRIVGGEEVEAASHRF